MNEAMIRRVVVLGLAIVLAGGSARAQTVGASLLGVVTDSSGAVVKDADVVVLSVATGITRELKTDATGHYRNPVLQPG